MNIIKQLKLEVKEFGILEEQETIINIKFVNTFSKNKIKYKNYEIEYLDEDNVIWHKDVIVAFAKNLGELQQVRYSHFWKTDMCFVGQTNKFYTLN